MMLKCWVESLKIAMIANTALGIMGRSTDETTCSLLQAAQSLMGKMDLKKNKYDINTTTKASTEAESSRSQSTQLRLGILRERRGCEVKGCESRRKVVACAVRVQTSWCGDRVYFVHHLIPWPIPLPETQEVFSRYLSLFMNE